MEFDHRVTGTNETETVSYQEIILDRPISYLIKIDGTLTDWFPKSVTEVDIYAKEIHIPRWLYEDKFV